MQYKQMDDNGSNQFVRWSLQNQAFTTFLALPPIDLVMVRMTCKLLNQSMKKPNFRTEHVIIAASNNGYHYLVEILLSWFPDAGFLRPRFSEYPVNFLTRAYEERDFSSQCRIFKAIHWSKNTSAILSERCAKAGNIRLFDIMAFGKPKTSVFHAAAMGGQLDMLRHLLAQNPNGFDAEKVASGAANAGQLRVLQWLRSETLANTPFFTFSPIKFTDCCGANGHIHILDWLFEVGQCELTEWCARDAAAANQKKILQWMLDHGFDWTKDFDISRAAIINGHIDLLKWVRSKGGVWDENSFRYFCDRDDLNGFVWAIENGCLYDTQEMLGRSAFCGSFKIFEWCLKQPGILLSQVMNAMLKTNSHLMTDIVTNLVGDVWVAELIEMNRNKHN